MLNHLEVTLEQLTNAGFTDLDVGFSSGKLFGKQQVRIFYSFRDDVSKGSITDAYEITEKKVVPLHIEGVLEGNYKPKHPVLK